MRYSNDYSFRSGSIFESTPINNCVPLTSTCVFLSPSLLAQLSNNFSLRCLRKAAFLQISKVMGDTLERNEYSDTKFRKVAIMCFLVEVLLFESICDSTMYNLSLIGVLEFGKLE